SNAAVVREKAQLEAAKGAAEDQAGSLTQEAQRFQARAKELEDQAAKLKRTVDEAKLQENRLSDRVVRLEMNEIVDASQCSTQELQEQIDIYKEKTRRELAELQRQLKERGQELERSQVAARGLQEE
ncbi:hypothetical protein CRUP_022636, partial [Coryphaenoides rupestris]